MPHTLTFAKVYQYPDRGIGIELPATLRSGALSVTLRAKFDPGSTFCVFRRDVGEKLGFDIERGDPQWIGTVTGRFLTYGHEATLEILGVTTVATVFFAADEHFVINVLGRVGLLDRVRLGLVDQDNLIYLSDYHDPA